MAIYLNAYDWAEEPLNGEVLYKNDGIIVDSDFDESPYIKAERNRRREAIGRRYLLGHIPLIQTASLRGPFGSKSGWITPWGRIKASLKDQRPSTSAGTHDEDTNTRQTINTESDTVAVEKVVEAATEEDFLDKHIDDDAARYDADNEDDAFEETNDEGRYAIHPVEHSDGSRAKYTYLSYGEPQPPDSDDNISDTSQKDSHRMIKHNGSKYAGEIEKDFLQNTKKRKVDTGWLKGANVLKRSRYEVLEHSSPTPVAGAVREGNGVLRAASSPQISNIETSDGQDHPQVLLIQTISKPTPQLDATNDTSTLPTAFEGHNDISWEVTEESTRDFLMRNRQSVAMDREEFVHNSLDINGLLQESQHQPNFAQQPGMQQAEGVRLSLSDLDVEDVRSLSSTRLLSRQGVKSTSLQDENEASDDEVPGLSTTSDVFTNDGIILSHLDEKVDFRDTSSPTSEDSFHYHRTSLKSQRRKSSPHRQKADGERSVTGKHVGTPVHDAQATQPTDGLIHYSSTPVSSRHSRSLEIQKSATSRTKKGGRRQHRTESPTNKLDALSEFGVLPSPDPLSEDFKDGHRQQTRPCMDQGLGQNPAKPSQDDIAPVDFQRTAVTLASQSSHQPAGGTQQSALQGLSHLSTSSISEDHMGMSISLTDSLEGQICDFLAQPSVLWSKADDLDETTLAPECYFTRRLSSQPELPEGAKAPISLSHSSQHVDILATRSTWFKGNEEPSQPPDLYQQVDSSSESTSTHVNAQVLEELATSTQSPCTAVGLKSLQPDLSLDTGSNESKCEMHNNITRRHLKDLPIDQAESVAFPSEADGECAINDADRGEKESFKPFQSFCKHSTQPSDEQGQPPLRLPSTQTLVDATTSNPWNSAFKKPRRRKSKKRVSFGPLPLREVVDADSDSSPKQLERMGSPPPPACTLRLTQLDDPFHYRLKATRDLEVSEESLTKFMNTPWHDIPALKPRVKPPSSSPAVPAMAEAFIAADQQNLNRKLGTKERSSSASLRSARTTATESFIQPRAWSTSERPEPRSSSPLDTSFSIAPNGNVTAVSIEVPGYDAEDNLDAVIEDMGSFLEGWDVESELKKAKVYKLEKGDDIKLPRKREYLSGVLNR